ncbi:MAG: redox-sensing transcriptional repressor Rex [Vicinamibacteraceae bacterium]|nr:redox-sensing transcriptional repressor Rex [Vicinamibacteraceae bacterium]
MEPVSEHTTARLSVYLRALEVLEAEGVQTVSSSGLAERVQLNPAQIRKDLAHFGEFGVRGVGYIVAELGCHLREILGLDCHRKVVIVGAGHLGLALADYSGFRREGFDIVALFDIDSEKVGRPTRSGIPVRHATELASTVAREGVEIAMLAVPAHAAQSVADLVAGAGVRAVLNFSPATLRVPEQVRVKHVDLTTSLESLSFHLARDSHAVTP